MFELNLEILSSIIIALSIAFRTKILKKLNFEGFFVNLFYFILVIAVVFPISYYRPSLIFSQLDEEGAKDLINQFISNSILKDFHSASNVETKPYLVDENLYNIKADIIRRNLAYKIYLQPTCKNNECSVSYDKAILVPKYIDISIENLGIDFFEKRSCSDYIVEIMLRNTIEKVFLSHFDILKKKGFDYEKKVNYINFDDITEVNKRSIELQNEKFSNSCSSKFKLNVELKQKNKDNKKLHDIFNLLYDSFEKNNDTYTLDSIVDYDISISNDSKILVKALPRKIKEELDKRKPKKTLNKLKNKIVTINNRRVMITEENIEEARRLKEKREKMLVLDLVHKKGMDAFKNQEFKKAMKYFKESIKKDYTKSYQMIGLLYMQGKGVEQNQKEALKWFKKAKESSIRWNERNKMKPKIIEGNNVDNEKLKEFYKNSK